MILIDRSKPLQTLVLTLTELNSATNPVYILTLKGDGRRDEFNIELAENLSPNTERYDLFELDTTAFYGLIGGIYTYSIICNQVLIETGKAVIKDVFINEIIMPNSSDEIIIYGG